MFHFKKLSILFLFPFCLLTAAEFTISSYNCGGLSDHYDYLRAVSMEKIMQDRYSAEPENMALLEKLQKVALKILFSTDATERALAQKEWDEKGYQDHLELLTAELADPRSTNGAWNKRSEETITNYKVRPVVIFDPETKQRLEDHLADLTLQQARDVMAERIFHRHVNQEIICLQEADYLHPSNFSNDYEVLLANTEHSVNGIAWKKERFELVKSLGNIQGRAFAVLLKDKQSDKTVLVASAHLSGCNPIKIDLDPTTGAPDSVQGDAELRAIVKLFNKEDADLKLIGMDSNVTPFHPRLKILQKSGYRMDAENFIEPTCTNPYKILNTRIDWIALKSDLKDVNISNIPLFGVGLNSIQTNMSDHKPIAAKVSYHD